VIRAFPPSPGPLVAREGAADFGGAVWIDLVHPEPAELAAVAQATGFDLPTREDMAEIEPSSRLYREGGAQVMTATLPAGAGSEAAVFGPVTFLLGAEVLVTLRYQAPKPFETYPGRADQAAARPDSPAGVMIGLIDEVVDRIADLLEQAGGRLDAVSREVFAVTESRKTRSGDFQTALTRIGREADFVAKLRACLVSMERVLGFFIQGLSQPGDARDGQKQARALARTQARDVAALTQHADALTQQTTLLLDATLGLISIEQSNIIKIFSVVAFVMLPPTLIASIYGMNFEHMPELGWRWAYPAALAGMVVSAVTPYLYFKRKGWL
jgi:magnesium transporter